MAGVLLLVFLLVPIVELFVIVQVAGAIGVIPALAFLVLMSVGGAWLVKREGLGVLRRMQAQLEQGELPTDELVDGVLILAAGALLLFPGYVTDLLGLLLLVPPVRAVVRMLLLRRYRHRLDAFTSVAPGGFGATFAGPVYDVVDLGDITPPGYRQPDASDRRGQQGPPPALGRG